MTAEHFGYGSETEQRRLDHVGIVVRSLDEAAGIYADLGFPLEREVEFQRGNGRTIRVGIIPVARGVILELLEDPEMLDRGAPALNHICLEVPDIVSELARLKDAGVPLQDERPRRGVVSEAIAFLQPQAADGVRIELTQKAMNEGQRAVPQMRSGDDVERGGV